MVQWFVLLPPLIILGAAFFTRNIILSVILGIVSAAFVAAHGLPLQTAQITYHYFMKQLLDIENLNVYGFVIILGGIITLINTTGGICQFSKLITKRLQSTKAVESSSLILSCFLCIDDYLSALTTGCIMKPLTDQMRIARVKLAFLVNTMASPIVVLVPISSWVALIVRQLKISGVSTQPGSVVSAEPFYLYLQSIPFVLYSFILVGSVWFIVRRHISYGPMHTQEVTAQQTGNLFGGLEPRFPADTQPHAPNHAVYLSDFFVPILSLITFTLIGIPVSGGYHLFGGPHNLLEAFRHTNIFTVLMASATASFIISCAWALVRHVIAMREIPSIVWEGFKLTYTSVVIIFCALIFSSIIDQELHTGNYLAGLLLPHVNIIFLPLIIFLISTLTALGTGSSWGTIGVVVPITIPIVSACAQACGMDMITLLPISIGAILSGAVAGAQLCPISDPVTMASISAGCYQIDHVKTQAWYLVPVITSTSIAFLISEILPLHGAMNGFVSSGIGLLLCVTLITSINYWAHKT